MHSRAEIFLSFNADDPAVSHRGVSIQGIAWILQLARVLSAHPAPHALLLAQGNQKG